jgi:hypothetical protein
MKKLIIVVIGFFIFILYSCFSTEHYLIRNINVFGVKITRNTEEGSNIYIERVKDTLNDRLYFRIEGEIEYSYGYFPSLFNKCYATSVPRKLDNSIDINSIKLMLDGEIIFNGNIIEKNTNLWNHQFLKEYQCYYEYFEQFKYSVVIGFNEDFYDRIFLSPADYNISLSCLTTDSCKLSKIINLFIKL